MSTEETEINRQFATHAHLRYVNDSDLKIRRVPFRKGFHYVNSRRARVRDQALLARIERLAIPPAWTEVRICPDRAGHIQAVGRDAKGRKQYRYHERWSELRNENKFERMADFGRALPKIRRVVSRDLRSPALTQKKVLAAIVRMLDMSAVRVGNEEYVSQNRSYGLTTLRSRHARVAGNNVKLRFRGKTGKEQEIDIRHPALARVVRMCQHLPGQKLFSYADDQGIHAVSSEDVNAYLAEITGEGFTAKDFRTWKASVLAMGSLIRASQAGLKPRRKAVPKAIGEVAEYLGNTPAICKKCYIHPAILEGYLNGTLVTLQNGAANHRPLRTGLAADEKAVLALLRKQKRLRRD